MEYLDTYDINGNFKEKRTRDEVHELGLWHNTVHCWLYDEKGNIYFQIRSDNNKCYTTASGHVKSGETLEEAFKREIYEEIGYQLELKECSLIDIITWKMDMVKKDGSIMKDRAKAHVYSAIIKNEEFHFDPSEVKGLAKVNAKETLNLFNNKIDKINATIIEENKIEQKELTKEDFLLNKGEDYITKYGFILDYIIKKSV